MKQFGTLLPVALLAACGGSEPEGTPPNIIFLMADDLGYAELGSYGQKWIQTPNIDSIAMDGIRFTEFYSGQAVCAPSRASLLTGKHQGHAYIRDTSKTPEDLAYLGEQYGWEFPGQYPLASEGGDDRRGLEGERVCNGRDWQMGSRPSRHDGRPE